MSSNRAMLVTFTSRTLSAATKAGILRTGKMQGR